MSWGGEDGGSCLTGFWEAIPFQLRILPSLGVWDSLPEDEGKGGLPGGRLFWPQVRRFSQHHQPELCPRTPQLQARLKIQPSCVSQSKRTGHCQPSWKFMPKRCCSFLIFKVSLFTIYYARPEAGKLQLRAQIWPITIPSLPPPPPSRSRVFTW